MSQQGRRILRNQIRWQGLGKIEKGRWSPLQRHQLVTSAPVMRKRQGCQDMLSEYFSGHKCLMSRISAIHILRHSLTGDILDAARDRTVTRKRKERGRDLIR